LYGCGTLFLTPSEELRLKEFKNRRFGLQREKINGRLKKIAQ
jgi:hypothetical protein